MARNSEAEKVVPSGLRLEGDREAVLTRVFRAPRRLVYEAMSKPEHLANWWGPRGFTLTTCEMDLRPGGTYRFVQRGPDGNSYPFKGVYREVNPPERLVMTQIFDVEPYNREAMLVTLELQEEGEHTRMTATLRWESPESRTGTLASGMEGGMMESYERLDELLAKLL
jgi:uncharacterized protein YndB with AHSA1/START domain